MIGYAKYVLVGLGALLFLFFTSRMLRRRENEAFAGTSRPGCASSRHRGRWPRSRPPRWARTTTSRSIKQLRSPVNVARQQVEELVERDPDRVAAQVRAWMGED